jgi:hypothetical protein
MGHDRKSTSNPAVSHLFPRLEGEFAAKFVMVLKAMLTTP